MPKVIFALFALLLVACTPAPTLPTQTPWIVTATPLPPTLYAGQVRISNDGVAMAYVPAGEFKMGSTDQDIEDALAMCESCDPKWYDREKPAHIVYLDSFWMDRYEVTNSQYATCMSVGKCSPPSNLTSYTRAKYFGIPQYNNHPVIWVNWEQAKTYCEWAGKRLPSEAEWEKAARGTDRRIFPWGNSFADSPPHNNDTATVGSFPSGASPYGIMDMADNVEEWVFDWYDEKYYSSSSTPSRNPKGPVSGFYRSARGGNWSNTHIWWRAAVRFYEAPEKSYDELGFRCVQ